MGIFHEELARDFPETPERFKECVSRAVAKQMTGYRPERGAGRRSGTVAKSRRFSVSKTLIPAAACLVLVCGTAAAASGLPAFQRWLEGLGANRQTAEALIIHGDTEQDAIRMTEGGNPEKAEDSLTGETLFTVTDAYFDGATLMFWAVPAEATEMLDFGDHVFINGSDNRLEYVVETEAGSGVYECKVTVMDEDLKNKAQEALDITVNVYMPDEAKREASFRIASDKLGTTKTPEDQILELSCGQAEVCDLHVAPSSVTFALRWKVYDEDALETIYIPDYFVEDSKGNRSRVSGMGMFGVSEKIYDEGEGCWTFRQEFELRSFDSSSEYMILIPYEGGYNEEGDPASGAEAFREDMSLKISLCLPAPTASSSSR